MDVNEHAKVWRDAADQIVIKCRTEFGDLRHAQGKSARAWEHMASAVMLANCVAEAYERAAAAQESKDG